MVNVSLTAATGIPGAGAAGAALITMLINVFWPQDGLQQTLDQLKKEMENYVQQKEVEAQLNVAKALVEANKYTLQTQFEGLTPDDQYTTLTQTLEGRCEDIRSLLEELTIADASQYTDVSKEYRTYQVLLFFDRLAVFHLAVRSAILDLACQLPARQANVNTYKKTLDALRRTYWTKAIAYMNAGINYRLDQVGNIYKKYNAPNDGTLIGYNELLCNDAIQNFALSLVEHESNISRALPVRRRWLTRYCQETKDYWQTRLMKLANTWTKGLFPVAATPIIVCKNAATANLSVANDRASIMQSYPQILVADSDQNLVRIYQDFEWNWKFETLTGPHGVCKDQNQLPLPSIASDPVASFDADGSLHMVFSTGTPGHSQLWWIHADASNHYTCQPIVPSPNAMATPGLEVWAFPVAIDCSASTEMCVVVQGYGPGAATSISGKTLMNLGRISWTRGQQNFHFQALFSSYSEQALVAPVKFVPGNLAGTDADCYFYDDSSACLRHLCIHPDGSVTLDGQDILPAGSHSFDAIRYPFEINATPMLLIPDANGSNKLGLDYVMWPKVSGGTPTKMVVKSEACVARDTHPYVVYFNGAWHSFYIEEGSRNIYWRYDFLSQAPHPDLLVLGTLMEQEINTVSQYSGLLPDPGTWTKLTTQLDDLTLPVQVQASSGATDSLTVEVSMPAPALVNGSADTLGMVPDAPSVLPGTGLSITCGSSMYTKDGDPSEKTFQLFPELYLAYAGGHTDLSKGRQQPGQLIVLTFNLDKWSMTAF